MADNIKLGAGGIRRSRIYRPGIFRDDTRRTNALQLKGTQETLEKLAESGIMPSENVETLLAAYCFLR